MDGRIGEKQITGHVHECTSPVASPVEAHQRLPSLEVNVDRIHD